MGSVNVCDNASVMSEKESVERAGLASVHTCVLATHRNFCNLPRCSFGWAVPCLCVELTCFWTGHVTFVHCCTAYTLFFSETKGTLTYRKRNIKESPLVLSK